MIKKNKVDYSGNDNAQLSINNEDQQEDEEDNDNIIKKLKKDNSDISARKSKDEKELLILNSSNSNESKADSLVIKSNDKSNNENVLLTNINMPASETNNKKKVVAFENLFNKKVNSAAINAPVIDSRPYMNNVVKPFLSNLNNDVNVDKEDKNNNAKDKEVFSILFPDFYEVDLVTFEKKKEQVKNSETENNNAPTIEKKSLANNIEVNPELEESVALSNKSEEINLAPLQNVLREHEITIYPNENSFMLETLIYQHRESIYKGLVFYEGKNIEAYIKKYSLNSQEELEIILNELEVVFEILNSGLIMSKNLNKIYGVYIDIDENYMYTFYEYNSSSNNLGTCLLHINYFQKLIILKNILKFVLDIHSLGIIHRDIRLEYFYVDSKFNLKIFDFSNARIITASKNEKKEIKKISKSFLTPKHVAPELSICEPRFGWAQDMWALGCCLIELFIDYSKYEDGAIEILLTKIFRTENQVPKIPKDIEQHIAQIIAKCFFIEPFNRMDIIQFIEKFNKYFKKNHFETIDISDQERDGFNKFKDISKSTYLTKYFDKKKKEEHEEIAYCEYNHNRQKIFYCENCDDFFCEFCVMMSHKNHLFSNVIVDLDIKKKILESGIKDIEDKFCDTNFTLIDEFRKTFENDFHDEEKRIKKQYEDLRMRIDALERLELENLEKSKNQFLENKFKKVFEESEKVGNYYKVFYHCKNQYFSHYNRFFNTLLNHEVHLDHFRTFNIKFEKFYEYSEILKTNADKLIDKCSSLRIPGKYIFRHEHYTDEMIKFAKSMETKVIVEKHKYFDYSGNDSLFLTKELLMIIPLTNCVFSYIKNSYKKIQVNFEINKIKIRSFLPGCATLHLGNNFYVTGGEIKDESSSSFFYMNIDEKVVEEGVEMNFCRRYHTMISLNDKYICVIGGWNSNEVEIIDSENLDYWRILPSMASCRSDPTVYCLNQNFLYVFGGWDYNKKKCVSDIERYEVFDSVGNIRFSKQWEVVKIKNNPVYLQKYNMGLIGLFDERNEFSEKILLVGGFDEEYDYSGSIIKVELLLKEPAVYVNKDIKGLPTDGESSFWYEKNFHLMHNDYENEAIAVNFNCFNNIYVYSFRKSEFKLYTNNFQQKNN